MEEIRELLKQIQQRGDCSRYAEILREISEKIDRLSGVEVADREEREAETDAQAKGETRAEIERFNKYW